MTPIFGTFEHFPKSFGIPNFACIQDFLIPLFQTGWIIEKNFGTWLNLLSKFCKSALFQRYNNFERFNFYKKLKQVRKLADLTLFPNNLTWKTSPQFSYHSKIAFEKQLKSANNNNLWTIFHNYFCKMCRVIKSQRRKNRFAFFNSSCPNSF